MSKPKCDNPECVGGRVKKYHGDVATEYRETLEPCPACKPDAEGERVMVCGECKEFIPNRELPNEYCTADGKCAIDRASIYRTTNDRCNYSPALLKEVPAHPDAPGDEGDKCDLSVEPGTVADVDWKNKLVTLKPGDEGGGGERHLERLDDFLRRLHCSQTTFDELAAWYLDERAALAAERKRADEWERRWGELKRYLVDENYKAERSYADARRAEPMHANTMNDMERRGVVLREVLAKMDASEEGKP